VTCILTGADYARWLRGMENNSTLPTSTVMAHKGLNLTLILTGLCWV